MQNFERRPFGSTDKRTKIHVQTKAHTKYGSVWQIQLQFEYEWVWPKTKQLSTTSRDNGKDTISLKFDNAYTLSHWFVCRFVSSCVSFTHSLTHSGSLWTEFHFLRTHVAHIPFLFASEKVSAQLNGPTELFNCSTHFMNQVKWSSHHL